MATTLQAIVDQARLQLLEPVEISGGFWTDAELVRIINRGIRDLWRSIYTKHQKHFFTVTELVQHNVGDAVLDNVPADCAVVQGLEPVSSSYPGLLYIQKDYNSPDFSIARRADPIDPSQGGVVYFDFTAAGAPVAAPIVHTAPKLTVSILLRLSYVPTIAEIAAGGTNPIPGESDQALVNWCLAYAQGKQAEGQVPDAGWLQLYCTEKVNVLEALEPRQETDDVTVEGMFEELW